VSRCSHRSEQKQKKHRHEIGFRSVQIAVLGMKHPTPDYPLSALREALQGVIGAGTAMLLIGTIGGAVPVAAGWKAVPSTEELLIAGICWIGHWAIAGVMIWGLFAALIPAWCFYELLHGRKNPWLVLAAALVAQLAVSTITVCVLNYDGDRERPVVASLSVIACLLVTAHLTRWRCRRRSAKERNRHCLVQTSYRNTEF
jgi:hypothetical protein